MKLNNTYLSRGEVNGSEKWKQGKNTAITCVFKAVCVLHFSSQKSCVHFCSLWCTPHAPIASLFFVLSPQWYLARSKITLQNVVFPNLLLLPLMCKCPPHHLFPNTLFPYLHMRDHVPTSKRNRHNSTSLQFDCYTSDNGSLKGTVKVPRDRPRWSKRFRVG